MLVAAGAATEQDVNAALEEQQRTRERIGALLVRRGVAEDAVARALAVQLRLPYAAPPLIAAPAAVALVDAALAGRHHSVPLRLDGDGLHVAMLDPLDLRALDDLQFRSGRRVLPAVATAAAIEEALGRAYQDDAVAALVTRLPNRRPPPQHAAAAEAGEEVGALRRASESAPIVALVDLIVSRASASCASDVHLEPTESEVRVRVRVDGTLRELLRLPPDAAAGVVSRIKIMAGLDIAERRKPQDGRAALPLAGRTLAARVSTLPSQDGEKVVLRLLDTRNAIRPLADLGFDPAAGAAFETMLAHSHGLILVTGPTGSGKTTTLYAALASLDREARNIVTLEDPVEYRLPGLTQVQIRPAAGLGFPEALRSVLRQDPDVIMVGELRDRETVRIALAAALTGHLVLATLHTNDAPSAAARLCEMGAPPYLVASALVGIVAQRLVRRLCPGCRVPRTPSPTERHAWLASASTTDAAAGIAAVYDAPGCSRCEEHGYSGRAGVYEVLTAGPRVRALLLRRAAADALRRACRADGMDTLAADVCRKVRDGTAAFDQAWPFLVAGSTTARLCDTCGTPVARSHAFCAGCGRATGLRCRCRARLLRGFGFCVRCGLAAPRPQHAAATHAPEVVSWCEGKPAASSGLESNAGTASRHRGFA
jgi:type IV pilus assembly protein PilB